MFTGTQLHDVASSQTVANVDHSYALVNMPNTCTYMLFACTIHIQYHFETKKM